MPNAGSRRLPARDWGSLAPIDELLDPARYLGEVDAIIDAALDAWRRARVTTSEGPVPNDA